MVRRWEHPLNAVVDIAWFVGKCTDSNNVQFLNTLAPMMVIVDGSLINVNEEQPENTRLPMVVMVGGSASEGNEEQPIKHDDE